MKATQHFLLHFFLQLFRFLEENIFILFILLFSLGVRISLHTDHTPFWDASAYIMMGKYIFSLGEVAALQPLRPVFWPMILGFLWKIHLDPIALGKILVLLFSLGSTLIVYLIGKIIFDKRVGAVAALFLSFSPTYFFWGNTLYTGIPSTFFGLLGIYLIFNKRFFWSGFLLGIAFVTRFYQFSLFLCIALMILYSKIIRKSDINPKEIIRFFLGFIVVIIPLFFIFNIVVYGHPFRPFIDIYVSQLEVVHQYYKNPFFYLVHLLTKENFCMLFLPVGAFFVIRKDYRLGENGSLKRMIICSMALFFLCSLHLNKVQDTRFLIPTLSSLYLISACGIVKLWDFFKKKNWGIYLISGLAISCIIFGFYHVKKIRYPKYQLTVFQKFIQLNEDKFKGSYVWITNPDHLVFANSLKAEFIEYSFNTTTAKELQGRLDVPDLILFNYPEFPCRPKGNFKCEAEKKRLIAKIAENFHTVWSYKNDGGEVMGGIFINPEKKIRLQKGTKRSETRIQPWSLKGMKTGSFHQKNF